jgi:hypothetical protein
VTPSGLRPTLPPTFTPTHTATDLPPPSATFTITPSPTFTPIPQDVLCEDFQVIFDDPDGLLYRAGERLTVMYVLNYPASVQFAAVSDNYRVDATLPGETLYVLTLDPAKFPISGRYTWTLSLTQGGRSGLCEQGGVWQIDNTPLPTSAPTITPSLSVTPTLTVTPASAAVEATAEVTAESTATVTPPNTSSGR